jgi:hypothetical protein
MKDGRHYWLGGLRDLPTLRVCMQCGATWETDPSRPWSSWGTITHSGPHVPNLREYRRVSPWPPL